MSEIFIVVIQERHSDVEVEAWTNLNVAIDRAREVAEDYARFPDDIHEADDPDYGLGEGWESGGWKFWLGWGPEGDSVRVQAVTVDVPS